MNQNSSKYKEIRKNTVKSTNQLRGSCCVSYENPEGKGIHVLFVGNSITRHAAAPEIGWNNVWGMAASAKEKDYVHRVIDKMNHVYEDAAYCICQATKWECEYWKATEELYTIYEDARLFDADIIVMRLIENCSFKEWDAEKFKTEYKKLISYLNPFGKAKVIVTTGFWHHIGDEAILEFARDNGIPCAELGDLGEKDEMKAIGLFEHAGVAAHPGDLGMEMIAERIFEKIEQI